MLHDHEYGNQPWILEVLIFVYRSKSVNILFQICVFLNMHLPQFKLKIVIQYIYIYYIIVLILLFSWTVTEFLYFCVFKFRKCPILSQMSQYFSAVEECYCCPTSVKGQCYNSTSCQECGVGYFQSQPAQISCLPCQKGSYTG